MDPVFAPIQLGAIVTIHHPASSTWQHTLVVTHDVNPCKPFYLVLCLTGLSASMGNNKDVVYDLAIFPFAVPHPNSPVVCEVEQPCKRIIN
eukprot:813271-Ditylum_brightwellii.AAC.2